LPKHFRTLVHRAVFCSVCSSAPPENASPRRPRRGGTNSMTSLPSVGVTILACAIAFSFFTRGAHRPERPILWIAFTLHLAAAAAQVLITSTVYRQGDMLSYWRVGVHLSEYLLDDPATT